MPAKEARYRFKVGPKLDLSNTFINRLKTNQVPFVLNEILTYKLQSIEQSLECSRYEKRRRKNLRS